MLEVCSQIKEQRLEVEKHGAFKTKSVTDGTKAFLIVKDHLGPDHIW